MPEKKDKKKFYNNKYLITSAIIILIIAGYFLLKNSKEVLPFDYITVERKDLSQVISVTGSVEPADSVELSFNLSGKITGIPVEIGDKVARGEVIAWLDTKDAETKVRTAEINLENAKLDLEKLRRQKDDSSFLVTRKKAEDELDKSYKEAFNLLSLIFSEIPNRIKNIDNYYKRQSSENEGHIDYYAGTISIFKPITYKANEFESAYIIVKKKVEESYLSYQLLNINSPTDMIDSLLDETYDAVDLASKTIRESRDVVDLYLQVLIDESLTPTEISKATSDDEFSELSSLSTKLENHLVSLLDFQQTIRNQKESIIDIDIDTESQELVVSQEENDLKSAKNNLSDHFIVSPFAGIITGIDGKVGAISGASQTVISMISNSPLEIEVNVPEVDIAGIKLGNSAQITLDAFGQDTIFDAEVIKIDPSAEIIDGVATYKVTLIFKNKYPQIKPGMTADIDILTESISNVLAVPSRSVIRRDGEQFIEILGQDNEAKEIPVSTGLRSSDGYVQIIEGLKIGDKVITFRQ